MLAVQECYISVCKEKDVVEKERENEVYNIRTMDMDLMYIKPLKEEININ